MCRTSIRRVSLHKTAFFQARIFSHLAVFSVVPNMVLLADKLPAWDGRQNVVLEEEKLIGKILNMERVLNSQVTSFI